jgi:glycosyltransferase involved in cell wall biosynthesis
MEKHILILGCKNYPAFSSQKVISSGMEVYVTELVKYLKKCFKVTIIAGDSAPSQDKQVNVISVPIFGGHLFQPVSLLFFSFLPALRKRKQIDLVNAQTPLSGLTAYILHKWFGIPYVVNVHMYSSSSAKTGNRLLSALYYGIEKIVYPAADKIVCAGYHLRDTILERHRVPEDQVVVINPGAKPVVPDTIDLSEAVQTKVANPDRPFKVLFLGRLVQENGIMDLLEAMKLLRDQPVQLLMTGNGNLEVPIRRFVDKEHLHDQVTLLGLVSEEDKVALLNRVNLVIRPSYHEVFPMAYLEALAHGVPVVATPVGDTEYMAEQTGGIDIVPVHAPVQIAEAIVRQIDNPGLDPAAVDHCKIYLKSISWDSQADRTIALFNAALRTKAQLGAQI